MLYRNAIVLFTLVGLAALGGCGTSQTIGAALPTPTPAPSATAPPAASASGTVVDEAANTPLAGVPVSLASWVPGATPTTPAQVATTSGTGAFTFTVTAGTYLLTIGSNSTTGPQATLNVGISLNPGANPLTLPTPAALPNVTYTAAQTSGNFRLMTLSTTQLDCLSGANAGRTALTLPALVPDEFLEEDVEATLAEEVAQSTFTPNPLFALSAQPFGTPNEMVLAATGYSTCDQYTNGFSYGNSNNPPYANATNGANVWYGGDVNTAASPYYGVQAWSTNVSGSSSAAAASLRRRN